MDVIKCFYGVFCVCLGWGEIYGVVCEEVCFRVVYRKGERGKIVLGRG